MAKKIDDRKKGRIKKVRKKLPVGRPIVYDDLYVDKVYRLALLGSTDEEICGIIGISLSTLNVWKSKHIEFMDALKKGRDDADANVANRLYQRAMGFEHDSEEIKVVDGEVERVPIRKIYPPDTTAAIFWLKNRQRGKWRDKVETGVTDKDGNDVQPVVIFKIPDNGRDT